MNSHHLDYDTLADLAEGLLDDERAASAGEHLTQCPECREREAELADVSRILAEAPVPAMPTGLAARIDAALAAERSQSTASPDFQVAVSSPRRLRRLQLLSAAAAAVVVVGGGATVAKIMSDSSVTAADGKASVPDASSPRQSAGPRPLFGGRAPNSAGGLSGGTGYRVISTGATYRDSTLAAQIHKALTDQGVPSASVPACVPALSGGRIPEVVDVGAHYKGSAATVLVFQNATTHGYDVVIAGPGCATGHGDVLTRVSEPAL
jgi:hypothetical protein